MPESETATREDLADRILDHLLNGDAVAAFVVAPHREARAYLLDDLDRRARELRAPVAVRRGAYLAETRGHGRVRYLAARDGDPVGCFRPTLVVFVWPERQSGPVAAALRDTLVWLARANAAEVLEVSP